jgi:SHS2 domain-containing protein
MKDFEQIPHTADIQIRVYGATKKELFAHALVGMFQVLEPKAPTCSVHDGRIVCPSLPITREIVLTASDEESLLVDFLSEAVYLSDVHNEAYLDVTIHSLTTTAIKATLHGISIEGFEVVEVKAVTYHNLAIKKINDVWQTDIVFDI